MHGESSGSMLDSKCLTHRRTLPSSHTFFLLSCLLMLPLPPLLPLLLPLLLLILLLLLLLLLVVLLSCLVRCGPCLDRLLQKPSLGAHIQTSLRARRQRRKSRGSVFATADGGARREPRSPSSSSPPPSLRSSPSSASPSLKETTPLSKGSSPSESLVAEKYVPRISTKARAAAAIAAAVSTEPFVPRVLEGRGRL